MPPHIPTILAILIISVGAADALAGQAVSRDVDRPRMVPVAIRASASHGRIQGTVRDQAGKTVSDASVVAMGTTFASVRSDGTGRFVLALPPGEYVLRATRDGYVSTFREPVRVQSSVKLERNITLLREDTLEAIQAVGAAAATSETHAHSALAWRLRHLRRSVLRDMAPAAGVPAEEKSASTELKPRSMLDAYARAASAYFLQTDFSGQLNWLTTGSLDLSRTGPGASMSGSVAYLAVGAPVGVHGNWSVRGALTAGEPSSWVMLGQYAATRRHTHAFTVGVSYGALRPGGTDPSTLSVASREGRTAGSVYGRDRWRIRPGIEVDYGLRADVYDYLATSHLFSPSLGARVTVLDRTRLTVEGAQHMIAPGADEFLPPASDGLWMPPGRTFSALGRNAPMRAEQVRRVAVGVERDFGPDDTATTVKVLRFHEETRGQLITLFGLGNAGASHYFSSAAGDVHVDGWTLGVSGRLGPHVQGTVDYSLADAVWNRQAGVWRTRRIAPSAVRSGEERLHDLSALVSAEFSRTSTRVSLAYRFNSGYSPDPETRDASARSRFDVEVRQALPYQPIRGGRLEALVGFRNLFRDLHEPGSMFDELLTIAPPTRFVGGLQVRF